jgi:hypothetical protein
MQMDQASKSMRSSTIEFRSAVGQTQRQAENLHKNYGTFQELKRRREEREENEHSKRQKQCQQPTMNWKMPKIMNQDQIRQRSARINQLRRLSLSTSSLCALHQQMVQTVPPISPEANPDPPALKYLGADVKIDLGRVT